MHSVDRILKNFTYLYWAASSFKHAPTTWQTSTLHTCPSADKAIRSSDLKWAGLNHRQICSAKKASLTDCITSQTLLTRAPNLLASAWGHAISAQAGQQCCHIHLFISIGGSWRACAPFLVQEDDHPAVPAVLCDLGDKLVPRYAAHRPKL